MDEQNNQNFENQEPEATKEELQESKPTSKKPIPKKVIIIAAAAIATVAVALILIFVVFKHKHVWSERTCTDGSYCIECGEVLYSYGNGHNFGEWITTTERTCTQSGVQERVCFCGEKETKTLPSGHNFAAWGICLDCDYGWVNINLPETPLTVRYYNKAVFEISDLRYELGRYDSGYLIRLFLSGTLLSGTNTLYGFMVKLVDSEGYTVYTKSYWGDKLSQGDKVKEQSFDYQYVDLDPNETYTMIITDFD